MGNIASSRSTSGGILSYVGQIAMKAHPALGHHFPRILTIKTRVLSSTASSRLTRWSRISTLSSDCRHQEQKQPMYACLSGVYQPKKSPPMKQCLRHLSGVDSVIDPPEFSDLGYYLFNTNGIGHFRKQF